VNTYLCSFEEVEKLILKGNLLILAADEELLKLLPAGNWIAGTTPYFADCIGGVKTKEKIFVTNLTLYAKKFNIQIYNIENISLLSQNYLKNGFSYIIIPSFSEIHKFYAQNCNDFEEIFQQPLLGWISGFDLNDKTQEKGKVFNGINKKISNSEVVILNVELSEEYKLNLGTVNLFEPGNGDIIHFIQKGFKVKECIVNDKVTSFSKYVNEKELNTTLPLVSYFKDININVSFKEVNIEEDYVEFYAPVFPNTEYQLASPVGIYETEFEDVVKSKNIKPLLSCNCILNFLYASLEGKKLGEIVGPITFGEISHVLLNQTMVYLEVKKSNE
jgi:hypothetical protein